MAVTPNYSWPVPVATDYVKDGWEAISDLGNAIDTTVAGLGSGGLSKITTTTLSNSASCIFTSLAAGGRYRIVGRVIGTAASQFFAYFREGSTNKTTSYNMTQWGYISASSFSNNNVTEIPLGTLGTQATNKLTFFAFDLYVHTDRTAGYINGQTTGADSSAASSPRFIVTSGYNVSMSALDGIALIASSGNLTGSVTLYQYED
jgi:hypothetical protein